MSQRTELIKHITQEARDRLLETLATVQAGDWGKPSNVEGWSIQDLLMHLAANQPSIPHLVRNITAGKGGARSDFDLNFYNQRGLDKRKDKSVDDLKAELAVGHADAQKLLDEISDEQLDMKGKHPSGGLITCAEIFHIMAYHDIQHTRHIAEALKSQMAR